MSKLFTILMWIGVLTLLLPTNSSLSQSSDTADTGQSRDTLHTREGGTGQVKQISRIAQLCPALTEFPVMLGRPAPCLETYSLSDH